MLIWNLFLCSSEKYLLRSRLVKECIMTSIYPDNGINIFNIQLLATLLEAQGCTGFVGC